MKAAREFADFGMLVLHVDTGIDRHALTFGRSHRRVAAARIHDRIGIGDSGRLIVGHLFERGGRRDRRSRSDQIAGLQGRFRLRLRRVRRDEGGREGERQQDDEARKNAGEAGAGCGRIKDRHAVPLR